MVKNGIKLQLFKIIEEKSKARPDDLKRELGVSLVTIHKHLKGMVEEGKIRKVGKPPLVYYVPVIQVTIHPPSAKIPLPEENRKFIEERYLYISPTGEILQGETGFRDWALATGQEKMLSSLAEEYLKIRKEADQFFQTGKSYIDATQKLQNTFEKIYPTVVYYQDFYSLPKFGKTRLGAYVLHAKQSQNLGLIKKIAEECRPVLGRLIEENKIDTVAFIPHSIPRQIPFLKELEKNLKLPLGKIELVKAYSGEIPIAQKSLSKLEERIANARQTFFVKKMLPQAKRVLLIDDAVGSGATMNEVAKMILEADHPEFVIGFAIVGSYKGFEVIREV